MMFNKPVSYIVLLDLTYQYGNYMHAFVHYTVSKDGDGYLARLKLRDKSEEESVEFPVARDTVARMEDMLNSHKVYKWNGFDKADKHVLDGRSFSVKIKSSDGREVYARGYASFPSAFKEVLEELEKILGIDNLTCK